MTVAALDIRDVPIQQQICVTTIENPLTSRRLSCRTTSQPRTRDSPTRQHLLPSPTNRYADVELQDRQLGLAVAVAVA